MHPIKRLKNKKGREELRQFILEGEKQVYEIPADWQVCSYACSQSYAESHDLTLLRHRAPVEIFRDSLFGSFVDTVTPQGILAVCKQKKYPAKNIIRPGAFLLIGEQLSDPGNIGALIRTAAAAGVTGVILSRGSGEVYNPKVLRASAGAVLKIPIWDEADIINALSLCKQNNILVYAAHPRGKVMPYDLNLKTGCAFLIGNEAHGLTDEATDLADALVKLPMKSGIESLNASIAGSILLYEAVRQKH